MLIWYYKEVFSAALVITDPGAKDRNSIPSAIVNENVIPMIVSLFNFALSVTGPKKNAVTIEKIIAQVNGSDDISRPRAAPANAACDIHCDLTLLRVHHLQ
jgi:hypothetical protein